MDDQLDGGIILLRSRDLFCDIFSRLLKRDRCKVQSRGIGFWDLRSF